MLFDHDRGRKLARLGIGLPHRSGITQSRHHAGAAIEIDRLYHDRVAQPRGDTFRLIGIARKKVVGHRNSRLAQHCGGFQFVAREKAADAGCLLGK